MTIDSFLKELDKILIRKQFRAISTNVRKVLRKINNNVLQLVISLDSKRIVHLSKNRIYVISQEYCKTIWYLQWPIFFDKRIATSLIYKNSCEYFSFTIKKKLIFSGHRRTNISKKSISLISFLSTSAKMIRRGDREWKGEDLGWDQCYIKITQPLPRLFLNFDPRNGGYEIRRRKMLPISRDRMSQQTHANGGYSSNGTQDRISQALIFIHKKKRRRQPRETEFLMYVLS